MGLYSSRSPATTTVEPVVALTAEVAEGIEEIRQQCPNSTVTVTEDGQGGAYVVVDDVELGESYVPSRSWIGFQLTFQYPYSDVYPHFIAGGVTRADGAPPGEAMSPTHWQDRPAIQVSRRSNRLTPGTDTAALKLLKVLDWIRRRP